MRTDRPNPNWPASTYNGFAGPAAVVEAPVEPEAAPRPRRRLSQPMMLGGIATAVAAGVALGFVAQPKPVSAAKAEAAATPMNVELAAPAPPAKQPVASRLDVRPVETAEAATLPPTLSLPEAPQAPPAPSPRERVEPPIVREAPPPELELEFDRQTLDDEPPLLEEEIEEPSLFDPSAF